MCANEVVEGDSKEGRVRQRYEENHGEIVRKYREPGNEVSEESSAEEVTS